MMPTLDNLESIWTAQCEELHDDPSDVFCVRYSPDSTLLAAGCADGTVRVFRGGTGRLAHTLDGSPDEGGGTAGRFRVRVPMTCMRWRPSAAAGGGTAGGGVLVTADAGGTIHHWRASAASSELLHTLREPDGNQVYALDFRADGLQFASAGKDAAVRVYDEATRANLLTLSAGMVGYPGAAAGHSSRIFSLRFAAPHEPSLLVSAGWDNTVLFWDLRSAQVVGSIYGPHVCGDALDIAPGTGQLLTGSWKPTKQLQLWDLRARTPLAPIPFRRAAPEFEAAGPPASSTSTSQPCKLYAAQFDKAGDGRLIAAGGSGSVEGAGELRLFRRTARASMASEPYVAVGRASLPKSVYSLDLAASGKHVAATAGGNLVQVFEVPERPVAMEDELTIVS